MSHAHAQLDPRADIFLAMNSAHPRTFLVDGRVYTLEQMVEANADDVGLCEWLAEEAMIGETFAGFPGPDVRRIT